jgi:hypothetical protein
VVVSAAGAALAAGASVPAGFGRLGRLFRPTTVHSSLGSVIGSAWSFQDWAGILGVARRGVSTMEGEKRGTLVCRHGVVRG